MCFLVNTIIVIVFSLLIVSVLPVIHNEENNFFIYQNFKRILSSAVFVHARIGQPEMVQHKISAT